MEVQDIMTTGLVTLEPSASVLEAARMMRDQDIGFIPVCEGSKVVGTLTDRDIVLRAVAEEKVLDSISCGEIMTGGPLFVYMNDDVEEAAEQMEKNQVRRLLVLNQSEELVGLVSIGDIAREHGDETLVGEIDRNVVEPREDAH